MSIEPETAAGRGMPNVPEEPGRPQGAITRARAALLALETLQRCANESRQPTSEEHNALRGWPGWGPLAPALERHAEGTWRQIGEDIAALLPRKALAAGVQATYNAFYTPPTPAAMCWDLLRGLDFTSGRILEPGCGSGAFIGTTPPDLQVEWVGVERDPTSARIASVLHPHAQIQACALQDAVLPDRSVDAVIGNVPFGNVGIHAPTAPKTVTESLHNYFVWRSVQALRPGGIAVLITSRYCLDAKDPAAREAINTDAELITALRLPNDLFASAGTDTCTDILVLRRRTTPRAPHEPRPLWLDTTTGPKVGYQPVNELFARIPMLILGELRPDRGENGAPTLRVDPKDGGQIPYSDVIEIVLDKARERGQIWNVAPPPRPLSETLPPRADGKKEGSFHLDASGEHVFQVLDGAMERVQRAGPELKALIRLRDAATALLDAETDHSRTDEQLAPLREQLGQRYDRYAKKFGALNRCTIIQGAPDPETGLPTISRRRPRMGGFRADPDYATVLALEDFDDETGQAAKAAIFTRRVNRPPQRRQRADTAAEAIGLCLDRLGHLDVPTIARLLDRPEAEVPGLLEAGDLAFIDPATREWVTADEYTSGNVRTKLARARAAVEAEPGRWDRNIAALEAVHPKDLEPEDIHAKLGAPWIPAEDVTAFISDVLGDDIARVQYHPASSEWEIKETQLGRLSVAATSEYGTKELDAYDLLALALNGKAPVVYDTVPTPEGGERRVRNAEETMLAEEKQRALSVRFSEWVWEEPDRADRLATIYNRRFNSVVLRRFDGGHLSFPGLAEDFHPYAHQRDMVHRMISTSTALCPYPVGTGKTGTMFLAAHKLKELGLVNKPLIVVPNHLLEQVAREGKRMFPAANILMTTKADLADATARKRFAARCATTDWDAIVMTHSAFTALPVHPRTHADYLDQLSDKYTRALQASGPSEDRPSRAVKRIAKLIDAWREKSQERLAHATDDGVYFEHLGVDYLMVDEAHYFKNLGIPVRTDGFSVAASQRATDLDLKLAHLRSRGDRVATLFTGTPVSNSLLEMHVLQHYLQPDRLEQTGLDNADAWAATFVEFTTSVEVAPDGSSFRLHRRPSRFQNVPELLTLFGEFAELRPAESFAVKRPDVAYETRAVDAGPDLRAYVADLAARADAIRAGAVQADEDNMLKICSDGRKAALDLALVEPDADASPKIEDVVATVAAIHHATKDQPLPADGNENPVEGRLQIIFCDLGTPNADRGSQVYGKIRTGLIHAGLPAEGIRFIHDAGTDTQKAALFTDCRNGRVNVLIGSTDKLGVGTNIQTRAIALHHVDAPWRPADVEQREGRIIRPGNRNPATGIFRYVAEGSFDSYMWQTLERKATFIRQIMSGTPGSRAVDDIGATTLDYGQVKALATGNPMLLELAELDTEIARLRNLATAHSRGLKRLENNIRFWGEEATIQTRLAADYAAIAATAHAATDAVWRDQHGAPIPEEDVPARLGELAAARSRIGPALTWQGLSIRFGVEGRGLVVDTFAYIRTGRDGIDISVKPAWLKKGQHWRLRDELTARITNAATKAAELRDGADELSQQIKAAKAQLGRPFEQASELADRQARRAQLDAAIRQAADDAEQHKRGEDHPAESSTRPTREPVPLARPEPQGLALAPALGLLGRTVTIHTRDGHTHDQVTITTLGDDPAESGARITFSNGTSASHVPLGNVQEVQLNDAYVPPLALEAELDALVSLDTIPAGPAPEATDRERPNPPPEGDQPSANTQSGAADVAREQAWPVQLASEEFPQPTPPREPKPKPAGRNAGRRRRGQPSPGQGELFTWAPASPPSDSHGTNRSR